MRLPCTRRFFYGSVTEVSRILYQTYRTQTSRFLFLFCFLLTYSFSFLPEFTLFPVFPAIFPHFSIFFLSLLYTDLFVHLLSKQLHNSKWFICHFADCFLITVNTIAVYSYTSSQKCSNMLGLIYQKINC